MSYNSREIPDKNTLAEIYSECHQSFGKCMRCETELMIICGRMEFPDVTLQPKDYPNLTEFIEAMTKE